ncbi:N-acetylmuramoyl-L-alanine amidase [Rossellomorea sp. NPDC077527]|uniref:N-acetylmuramoyl-L-alanine amidase n=1 Tax=Rossellomorea sp. NPDC077527 TaxID=3364510 RepID=UPI0037C6EA4F
MLRRKVSLMLLLSVMVMSSVFAGRSMAEMQDIPSKFSEEIEYLLKLEVITGYPDSTFKPDRNVTREEAATMIGRALKLDGEKRETSFNDVNAASYASGYIQSAYEKGIINGYGDGSFYPSKDITRGEMAFLISKAFKLEKTGVISFKDVAKTGAQSEAINKLTTAGIADGYPDGTYKPDAKISRSEFSLLVARGLNSEFRVEATLKPIGERFVNTTALNVRSGPDVSYDKVGQVSLGNKLLLYQTIGDWAYISYGSLKGYVHTAYLSESSSQRIISIDAGHGGDDNGASGNGLLEKEINLAVALKLRNKLEDEGIKVVMPRTTDVFVELNDRVQYSVQNKADTFLSIHTNSFSGDSAHGTETYYYTSSLRSEESKQLATFVNNRLYKAWGTLNRGVKVEAYRVIAYNPLPAALVELGFISNKDDSMKLGSNQYRDIAAEAICQGILDYYEWKESK